MSSISQSEILRTTAKRVKNIVLLLLLPALSFGQTDPVVTSSPVTSVDETVHYLYEITVEDGDGDNISVSASALPGWLNLRGPESYQVSTLAGSGTFTHPPVDGTGTEATFIRPIDLTTDSHGNIYVIDDNQFMIRKITPAGVVTTFVGAYGVSNIASVDGTGTDARFRNISGITIDHNDNIYLVDLYKIRKITPEGVVSTVAGDRNKGTADGTGTAARFEEPTRLAADSNGDLFVCDRNNYNVAGRIRKVTPDGVVTTFAGGVTEGTTGGTGTDALFFRPFSIAIDGDDNVYFAELRSRIYKMTPQGVVTPFAGNGANVELDGTGTDSGFRSVRGLATDGNGNLYVVSGDNSSNRVRKVSPAGVVTSPIGSLPGFIDGFGTDTKFSSPMGVTVASDGTIYVADKLNSAIRKVVPSGYLLEGDATGEEGVHNVTLNITDDNGGTATQSFSINVTDSTDPVFTSAASVPVTEQSTGTVYTATATDTNTLTFALGSSLDNALFNIDQNSGEVSFKSNPVWSAPADTDGDNIYQISVVVSDGSNSITAEVTLIVYPLSTTLEGEYIQIGSDIDGEVSSDWWGHAVSLNADGSIMAIGAPFSAETGGASGDVRVFQYTNSGWTQLGADISGARSASHFGNSVSLSADGKVLAAGATGFNANGTTTGYTAIYAFENGDWVQIGSNINGESVSDQAGTAVALSEDGQTVAIGATGNSKNGSFAGQVRVYRRQGNSWVQLGADIDGEAAADYSGSSVAISATGNTVAIGAPFNDGNFDKSGHVRVYSYINDQWTQLGIDINGQHGGDEFGTSVDLSADGQVMAVGGRYNDVNGTHAGHVRVFRFQNGNWNQLGSAILGDAADAELGWRVAITDDGSIVAATARQNQIRNEETKGEIKVFRFSGLDWEQLGGDIIGENGGDYLGFSLSINGDGSVIGAGALISGGVGYVRAFELTNTPPEFTSALVASFAENGTGVAYTAQATDSEAIIYSLGTENDESLFSINGSSGQVSFVNAPDFENPADDNNDGDYVIQVKADDGTNEASQLVTISVTNVSDVNPVFTSNPVTTVDDDTDYTYDISTFDIDGDLSTVSATSLPDWLTLVKTDGDYVSLFAGSGSGFNDGAALAASFNGPNGIVIDRHGNIYVADRGNGRIRKITPGGQVTTLAGNGNSGSANGTGTNASFSLLGGMTIDRSGNIYATDQTNNKIRKITPEGVVSTFAGSGGSGNTDGARLQATFRNPVGLDIDLQGNIYVADFLNHRIRKISNNGQVTTVAGSGGGTTDGTLSVARFRNPTDVAVDNSGNVYVADRGNNRIRKINTLTGMVSTLAGSTVGFSNGTGAAAKFSSPSRLEMLSGGNFIVSDAGNHSLRIMTPGGVVSTMAGNGSQGNVNGPVSFAQFDSPAGVAINRQGTIYVSDFGNDQIKRISDAYVRVSGNPSGQAGTHNVTLTANDSGGGTAEQSFTISVADKTGPTATIAIDNLDMGPSETGQVTINFNEAVNNFTNDDLSIPNGTLSPVSSADGGKTFTATYNPTNGIESATNTITLDLTQVEDQLGNLGVGTVSSENFTIDTEAPVFTSVLATEFAENSGSIVYTAQATDQSTVTFSKTTSNDGAEFNVAENGQVSFSSAPDFESPQDNDQNNVYLLEITATDAKGNTSAITLSITVTNVNDNPPSFISEPITMANEGEEYIYNVRATDPDGDALSFTGSFPSWLSLGANQGMQVTTIAGSYQSTFTDGAGTDASFNNPYGIDIDDEANIYVADYNHNRIRKITPAGEVTTLAGSGRPGNEDSFQELASFNRPSDLVVDASGTVYVTDENNFSIRKITPAGLVSTLAGGNGSGTADGTGTDARFGVLKSIDIDGAGNLYIADKGNSTIRKVSPAGVVSTFAGSGNFGSADGTGTNASFANLEGIVLDNDGNVYVTDGYARNVRKITTAGVVTTLAGSGSRVTVDGTGTEASFFNLNGIDVDDQGNVYVAEFSRGTIRKITPEGVVTSVVGGNSGVDAVYSASGIVWVPGGTIYATDGIDSHIYKLRPDDVIELIAGGGSGELKNGDLQKATLNGPHDLVVHQPSGNIFFTDRANHVIRKISPDGQVSTFAGSGTAGYADGSAGAASFDYPYGLAMNSSGFLFVADLRNNRIRMIDANGNVSTFAGSGDGAFADGTGALASFNSPRGLTIDEADNLYVSDMSNVRIRKVSPSGVVTTLAGSGAWNFADGTGTEAAFVQPMGLSLDSDGNLYVADQGNNRIRKITQQGVVTTFAGSGTFESKDGTGTNASFASPVDVLVDASGNIYVAENNRIRLITSEGVVSTFAGSGEGGADDGIGVTATLGGPSGLAFNKEGDILVAEAGNHLIRKISVAGVSLTGNPTGQIGEHNVTLTVSDGGGNTDQQSFKIEVRDSDIPVFTSAKTVTVEENTTSIFYTATAIDANTISYSLLTTNEAGYEAPTSDAGYLSMDPVSGDLAFNSNVDFDDALDYNGDNIFEVILLATDASGNEGSLNLAITLTESIDNSNPVFASQPVLTASDDQEYCYLIKTTDAENNPITLMGTNLPGWLSLVTTTGGEVTTLAGNGGTGATNGTGTSARFNFPAGITVDDTGNLYVVDQDNHSIRMVSPEGVVTPFAGSGVKGFADGTGSAAQFSDPKDITIDSQGYLYVADFENHRIRKITPDGVVSTLAGTGGQGAVNGTGTSASFNYPAGVAVDASGNVYVVDQDNHGVRKISPAGVVSTFAGSGVKGFADGSGTMARFSDPKDITIDRNGNLYIADFENHRIRKITAGGVVSTVAGTGILGSANGTGSAASFNHPAGIAVDLNMNLYVVDQDNHSIRKISADGVVTTLAGAGIKGFVDGTGSGAQFSDPKDITIDSEGNLYIADFENHRIRKITTSSVSLKGDPAGQVGDHNVTLTATDGNGGTAEQSFVVTVTDNTPPVFTSGTTADFAENGTGIAYTALATDSESLTYSLGTDEDESLFSIDGTSGAVSFLAAPDFENPLDKSSDNIYRLEIVVTDGVNQSQLDIAITVSDVNDDPIFTSTPPLSISEGAYYRYDIETANQLEDEVTAPVLPGWLTLVEEGQLTTLAGSEYGTVINGTGTQARFRTISDVTVDKNGVIYAAEPGNRSIRRITREGVVTTLAGEYSPYGGVVDGTGTDARFDNPRKITLGADGNLYVAEVTDNLIRRVTLEGVVTTIAGSGTAGNVDGKGAEAQFENISSLVADSRGNIFVGSTNGLIRKVTLDGIVTTFAGNVTSSGPGTGTGTAVNFESVRAMAIDQHDNLYVDGLGIQIVSPEGVVSSFMSKEQKTLVEEGVFTYANFIAVDKSGNVYLANDINHVIKKITPGLTVTTLAGSGQAGHTDGIGTQATIDRMLSFGLDDQENLIFTDFSWRLRRVNTRRGLQGSTSGQQGQHAVSLKARTTDGEIELQDFTIDVVSQKLPVFTSPLAGIFKENRVDVAYTIQASDVESINYSLGTGNDESLFTVDGTSGEVRFISPPDYENPADADSDNHYSLEVRASDGVHVASQLVTIAVSDVFENMPPVFTSNPVTTVENKDLYSYPITAEDPDGDALSITSQSLPGWLNLNSTAFDQVSTFSGYFIAGHVDGDRTDARYSHPAGLVQSPEGDYYVGETTGAIRKISANGEVSTLAGLAQSNSDYRDGTGSEARFGSTEGLALDDEGNLYVADRITHTIRKVTPEGIVTTLAGNGEAGNADGTGTEARFNRPTDIVFHPDGNLYFTDRLNHKIRKVTTDGVVTTFIGGSSSGYVEGNATEALLDEPTVLTVDVDGNLYFYDDENYRIRKVTPAGVTSYIAGSSYGYSVGTGTEARFSVLGGITIDGNGNLYISDLLNHRVRKVTQDGITSLMAGGWYGFENGSGTSVKFNAPSGLILNNTGELILADQRNHQLRKLSGAVYELNGNPAQSLGAYNVSLQVADGNGGSALQNFTVTVSDNTDPEVTSGTSLSFAENGSGVFYTLQATDIAPLTYSLSSDQDESLFSFNTSTGELQFITPPDFEQPSDSDADNVYHVGFKINDGTNEVTHSLEVIVTNMGDDPTILSLPETTIEEGDYYQYDIEIKDEYQPVDVTSLALPDWLTLTREAEVTTLVGSVYGGEDGTGTEASFINVYDMVMDEDGIIYAPDQGNNAIRKITPDNVVTTLAGSGRFGRGHVDGTGTNAMFYHPKGIALGHDGNLYVTDATNNRIRKVTKEGVVTTFAGSGEDGYVDGTGTGASFSRPEEIEIDSHGNLFVTGYNNVIRKITPEGVVSTFAGFESSTTSTDGTGSGAGFARAGFMVIDESDNIYISDGYRSIRKVTPEAVVSTVISSEEYIEKAMAAVPGGGVSFHSFIIDDQGDFYLPSSTDRYIFKLDQNLNFSVFLQSRLYFALDGVHNRTEIRGPKGILMDKRGDLVLSDYYSIRKISRKPHIRGASLGKPGQHSVSIQTTADDGSSDTQNFVINVTPAPIPVFTSPETADFVENGIGIAYEATVSHPKPLIYSLSTGNDESLFSIDGTSGEVTFIVPPDFENPGDGDVDNEYTIEVKAGDGIKEASQLVTITVTDTDDTAPIVTSVFANNGDEDIRTRKALFLSVKFSEPVIVTGTPKLELETGVVDGVAEYITGSGTDELLFIYTVQGGDFTEILDYTGTAALTAGTSIEDSAGNTANLTLPAVGLVGSISGNNRVSIDTRPEVTLSVNKTSVLEGDETFEIRLSLSFASRSNVVVDLDFSGTADIDTDYTMPFGTSINLQPGTLSYLTAGLTKQDNVSEPDETVVIAMSNISGGKVAEGEEPGTITIIDDEGPVFSSGMSVDFNENGTGVAYTAIATDYQSVAYSLSTGNDEALFSIEGTTGEVTFIAPPDFENPQDGDLNNQYVIQVRASDGTNEATLLVTITVRDVTPPAKPVITSISDDTGSSNSDGVTNDKNIIIYGTAEPNARVEVSHQFGPLRATQADANGDWLLDVTDITLREIVANLTAEAIDLAGNRSEKSDVFVLTPDFTAPAKPVITGISDDTGSSDSDGVTNDSNITVSGTAEPNARVEVSHQFGPLRTTQADANGDWLLDITDITLIEFVVNLKAEAIDLAGNRSETSDVFVVTPDFTAPAKPVITGISDDTGSSGSDGVTNDKNIVIYGTAEPNAKVEVFHQLGPLRAVQADVNGDWLLDVTDITLRELVVNLTAEATDLAGNRSETSDVFVVTPDFTAPARPVITGISDDTGSSDSDGVTSDKNITISGTAEPDATVLVSHQFGPLRTTQADANGNWLLDITDITLIEFVVNLTAEAIDLAGNRSETSDVFVVTPDYTAPARPVITGISDDTGSSDSDGITNDKNITISGTAEPDAKVLISHQFGPLRITQADANGNWLLDVTDITLIELAVSLHAEAIDLAGNISEASDVFMLTPDFTAPTVSINTASITPAGHTITALFDEEVSGLTLAEISVTGGTAGNLVQTSATSYTFLVSLSGSTADVQINAGAAQDLAGNNSDISNQLTLNITPTSAGEGFTRLPDLMKTEQVHIYPNPASKLMTIDLSELSAEAVDIYMYNAAGTSVFKRESFEEKTLQIDVSEFTSGIYIVQLYDGIRIIRKKVMVKK